MKGEAVTVQARGMARPAPAPPRSSLPGPLEGVPLGVLAPWVGLGAITVVVALCTVARSDAAVASLEEDDTAPTATVAATAPVPVVVTAPPAPPKPPGATPAELAAAGKDPAALSALADRYPQDPAVMQALFLAHAADKKGYTAALRAALKLLELAPDRADDLEVQKALVAIASGPPDTSSTALELIVAKTGRHAPDLIYEIAQGFSPAKLKAAQLLKDPEVRKLESPALVCANDLRETLPCARKAMAGRAAAEGDARSIEQLKPLLNTNCGLFSRDCYRCVTPADRKAIEDAIAAIEKREAAIDKRAIH
jgi:hypothetical protein